jgi:Holliday junction resolvase
MKYGKIDDNQTQIVKNLRKLGYSVAVTSGLAKGFPDIIVGKNGKNWMIEIKDGDKPPSKRTLTDPEIKFHAEWQGQIAVCNNIDEVLKIIK